MARHHIANRFAGLLCAALSLAACGDAVVPPESASEPPTAQASAVPSASAALPDAKVGNSLPVAKALVRIHAHVATSLALHRAGQTAMAQGHVQDALNDAHSADLRSLAELQLNTDLLNLLATAGPSLHDGVTPARIEAHFDDLTYRAGASPLVLAQYALTQMLRRYEDAVAADQPVDVTSYQLAFGLATVANHRASSVKGDAGDALRAELGSLLELWPEGPLPPQFAATTEQVRDQVDRIRDILRYAR